MLALICRLRPARWPRQARLLFVCSMLGLSNLAWAADRETAILTLPKALARVLQSSPELAVYPYEIRAAEARTLQAGLRPNPVLSVEVENVLGNGAFWGLMQWKPPWH